jgi:hypothetical protein
VTLGDRAQRGDQRCSVNVSAPYCLRGTTRRQPCFKADPILALDVNGADRNGGPGEPIARMSRRSALDGVGLTHPQQDHHRHDARMNYAPHRQSGHDDANREIRDAFRLKRHAFVAPSPKIRCSNPLLR